MNLTDTRFRWAALALLAAVLAVQVNLTDGWALGLETWDTTACLAHTGGELLPTPKPTPKPTPIPSPDTPEEYFFNLMFALNLPDPPGRFGYDYSRGSTSPYVGMTPFVCTDERTSGHWSLAVGPLRLGEER
jgi:hypothetical protein